MAKEKFFSVNMNTTEEPKPQNTNNNTTSSDANRINVSNSSQTNSNINTEKKGIKFNQADLDKKMKVPNTVRLIENPDELFGTKKEKMTGKDLKLVLLPGIVLIIISIVNELFLVPLVINKVVTYVLDGKISLSISLTNLGNEQLLALAGLIAIVSYCIFSISLFIFSIYNMFRRVYVKKDLIEIAGKIMLYAFLIGFVIIILDSFIPINLSELIVKITTIGLHSMKSFITK